MVKTDSWSKALEAGRLLSSSLEIDELLRAITRLSAELVEAESASLLLLDSKTQELYFDVALGLGDDAAKVRLKVGQGIAGTVAAEKKALLISDVRSDSRWSSQIDARSGFSTRSILAVPLIMKDRLLGVVEAINKKEGTFSEDDAQILAALASQAAIALENARLFTSLKEERLKLGIVFLEMADGAILAEPSGKISIANHAARKLIGEGETLASVFSKFTLTPPWSEISARLASGPIHFTAERHEVKPLILGGVMTQIKNAADPSHPQDLRPVWLCIFRDETEFKRNEAVKRTFLSFISHKLKTPLASVIGFADILSGELGALKASTQVLHAAEAVQQQSRKLSGLVDKLLRYTALESPEDTVQFAPCFLNELISETLGDLESLLKEKGGDVSLKAPQRLEILANRLQIKTALSNLIENAVKFDPNPQKKIHISLEAAGRMAVVNIEDSGSGIPPEDIEKIFSRFHQIEAYFTGQVEGLGLGLPYVKQVAINHGGKIEIKSRLGAGTTASLSLPLREK